jgi:spermidine/putrescine ABC transporter ATP-binding subunit
MSRVKLERVAKHYGDVVALQEMDLEIQEGEFLTLLGPSGCGKTTTLRLIAGFIEPTKGTIYLGNDDVTFVPPQKREIGMVFQDYALFPHMTIADNIGFGLKERGVGKEEIRRRVGELLDLIHLPGVGDRYPAELSGGQAQRVAVARAVAYAPRVLLMDEPLGALDLKLREAMQIELRRIQQELKITTVYVTHDQGEAMNMSDRITVMNHGLIEQMGSATEIYNHPRTKFVADFIGSINFLPARIVGKEGEWVVAETVGSRIRVPAANAGTASGDVSVAIRPERLRVVANGPDGANVIEGRIANKIFHGNLMKVFVDIGTDHPVVVEGRPLDAYGNVGDPVRIAWEPDASLVLTR